MKNVFTKSAIFLVNVLCAYLLMINNCFAQPTFFGQASTPADNSTRSAQNATVTAPGSMVKGDLVILYAQYRGDGASFTVSTNAGQTWTAESAYNGAANQTSFIAWCTYSGTWSGNPTVSTTAVSGPFSLSMYVFRPTTGNKNLWAVDIAQQSSNSAGGTGITINGVTTTKSNSVTMAFWGSSDDNTYGSLSGTGWSKSSLSAQIRNTSGSDQSHSAAYNIKTSPTTLPNVSQDQTANGPDPTNTSIMTWYQTDAPVIGGRMKEVFRETILSPAGVLQYPWEIAYGADDSLWITEARGYKVFKFNKNNGGNRVVLNLTQGSTGGGLTNAEHTTFNVQFALSQNPWPQGGMAGLALHPKFLDPVTPKNFVYIAYVWRYDGGSSPNGILFTNKIVRFTYDPADGLLKSPVEVATLPGSGDHNSQRLITAPVTPGGTSYLFYGEGDMGSGQFGNRMRPNNSQNPNSVEGKILRFNLESDGDAGAAAWIPNDNPYSATSSVYSIGMRNNQGFAYDTATNTLYGSTHGPYSDDEINIIESHVNHGHPLIIGYVADGNYDSNDTVTVATRISAGSPLPASQGAGVSTCPPVGSEATWKTRLDANGYGLYKDPLFSAYPASKATITNTWQTNPGNANWYSEGWSGLDLYSGTLIPGWKRSLVAAGLKWGRLIRLKLSPTGTTTLPSNLTYGNTGDTVIYFQSTNRYRDLAFAPNGKDIFMVMDNSSATSGPGVGNPTVAACPGCVLKYTFLGYADEGGFSAIPKEIPVTDAVVNTCNTGTTITIDDSNNNLWVPITGPDGNIMAEINAMGQNLGLVTSSFYKNSGAVRVSGSVHYLDRNITITPAVTSFSTPVKVRLYISEAELAALIAAPSSGITNIDQLRVLKNVDPCSASVSSATTMLTPTNTLPADLQHGANGYVLQVAVSGFSSFYFAPFNVTLPLNLISFQGSLKNDLTTLLNWKTGNEVNTSRFVIERSGTGQNFHTIATEIAKGTQSTETNYTFNDLNVADEFSKNVFYRLKVYDKDGTYRYSNIVTVTLPAPKVTVNITPNPAYNELRAKISSPEVANINWQIIDNAGRIMLSNNDKLSKGKSEIIVNISQLAAGSYYFKITGIESDSKTQFQKL